MAPVTERGSVLVVVLALLGLSTLVLVNAAHVQQSQMQQTVVATQQAELQVYARSILRHAGIMLELGHSDTAEWQSAWQLPNAIQAEIELEETQCPNEHNGCYRVDLILTGRGGARLERRRHYWAEAGCGHPWEEPE